MRRLRVLAALGLGVSLLTDQAGAAGVWVVAMPPFRAVGGAIVADDSAPLSEWVREGSFTSEAACQAELRDQAARIRAAEQITGSHADQRLTPDLKHQVIEAVRQARCVSAAD